MAWTYALFMIVIGFFGTDTDNASHIGGFIGGFLAGVLLDPARPRRGTTPWPRWSACSSPWPRSWPRWWCRCRCGNGFPGKFVASPAFCPEGASRSLGSPLWSTWETSFCTGFSFRGTCAASRCTGSAFRRTCATVRYPTSTFGCTGATSRCTSSTVRFPQERHAPPVPRSEELGKRPVAPGHPVAEPGKRDVSLVQRSRAPENRHAEPLPRSVEPGPRLFAPLPRPAELGKRHASLLHRPAAPGKSHTSPGRQTVAPRRRTVARAPEGARCPTRGAALLVASAQRSRGSTKRISRSAETDRGLSLQFRGSSLWNFACGNEGEGAAHSFSGPSLFFFGRSLSFPVFAVAGVARWLRKRRRVGAGSGAIARGSVAKSVATFPFASA
jgi:hypothetical protein